MAETNWEVVNNGLDFLESAVDHLAEGDARALRYAALHLGASVEILLKARLAREHWALVTSDANKATRSGFETGVFTSVGTEQAMTRLENIANVTFPRDARDRFAKLGQIRNRVAHFTHLDSDPLATQTVVAAAMDALIRFIEKELVPGAPNDEKRAIDATLETVMSQVREIDVLVRERMNSLKEELAAADFPVVKCPECLQDAYVFGDGENGACLFCRYAPAGETAAGDYGWSVLNYNEYRAVKEGGERIITHCLSCGAEAMVEGIVTVGAVEAHHGCFACGFYATQDRLDRCWRCGEWTSASGESGEGVVCSNCMDRWMNED
ncbi:hypothetical protein [Streptosporangium sp. G12]